MRVLLLIVFGLLSAQSFAQKAGFFSVESASGTHLRLSDLDTEVKIDGAFAETTLDIGYANESQKALQGLFKIQLPHGAVVRDFALRIGDKWQFGTLTEKHKARQTFEEIVRRGADPAVLAWNNGAEYQVRIFPFPAHGKRYIRLRYWQELPAETGKFVYNLPLPAGVKLDTFHLKLNAQVPSLSGVVVGESFARLVYMKPAGESKDGFGAILEERNFTIPGAFHILSAQNSGPSLWTGRAAPTGDMNYVGARFFTSLPTADRTLPKRLLVFLDTSRSARPDHPSEVAQVLQTLTGKLPKTTKIDYFEFDAAVRKVENLDIEHTSYDGGTDFKSVLSEIQRQRKQGEVDALILSDAIPTMQQESEFTDLHLEGSKIFVLPSKSKFNPHFAALLAEKSGGAILPQASLANSENIIKGYTRTTWRFESLRYDDGSATDVYPEAGTPISAEDGISVYFRCKSASLPKNATVIVGDGVTHRELKVSFATITNVPEVENLWAMKKLMNLIPHASEYPQDLAAHALRYKLVSPQTSYIVLENTWDYQQFNIEQRAENSQPMDAVTGQLQAFGSGAMAKKMGAAPPSPSAIEGLASRNSSLSSPEMEEDRGVAAPSAQAFDSAVAFEPPPVRYQVQSRPELDQAITASKASAKYAWGFFFGRGLDKLYAEKNTPTMKDAWFFVELAKAFSAKGEKQKALRVLSNLFEISEEDGKALRTMGLVGCFQDSCELAVQAFKMAIELRPEEPQNYRDLAWLYAEMGQLPNAQATLAQLKGKQFHSRFPGMDQLLVRETAMIDALAKGDSRSPSGDSPQVYSWITWNNDNSDVDFHIRESKTQTIWYQNRVGHGELSNDFTRGYGPEVYTARDKDSLPSYYVHYFRPDGTSESQAVVVKFASIERMNNGKVKIHSRVFPLYNPQQYLRVD